MNHKGFTLSLVGMDVNRTPISRNQVFMFVIGVAAVLLITSTVFLSASAVRSNVSSGIAVGAEADSARWIAMGEAFSAEALEVERIAATNTARWIALGEHYGAEAFDAERSAAANTARWSAMGELYDAKAFDAEHIAAVNTARWTALGAHYAVDEGAADEAAASRYQAMAEWYTR